MNVEKLHSDIKGIQTMIESRGLKADVHAHINWFGDAINISVRAYEPFDPKGHWSSEKDFASTADDCAAALRAAHDWAYALPGPEDRAMELLIQKLNKLAGELPDGGSDIARAAWLEIHRMLTSKAESIAKNGLPSPARIQQLKA